MSKPVANYTYLPFTMQPQKQTQWCWAAAAVSVCLFYNPSSTMTQCNLVNTVLIQTTCCQNGGSTSCNQPWDEADALEATGNYNSFSNGPASFAEVEDQIDSHQPIAAGIDWSLDSGHVVVINGYVAGLGGSQIVDVEDPWYGPSTMPYSTLVSSYHSVGTWGSTFYTQA